VLRKHSHTGFEGKYLRMEINQFFHVQGCKVVQRYMVVKSPMIDITRLFMLIYMC
jgi:hypothetical protein